MNRSRECGVFKVQRPLAAVLTVLFAIAGCASLTGTPGVDTPVGPDRARQVTRSVNLSGFPPEYQRGFSDGCAQAGSNAQAKPTAPEAQYQSGWNDGLAYCKRRPPK